MGESTSLSGIIENITTNKEEFTVDELLSILYCDVPMVDSESYEANEFERYQVHGIIALKQIVDHYELDQTQKMNINDSQATKKIGELLRLYNTKLKETLSYQNHNQNYGAYLDHSKYGDDFYNYLIQKFDPNKDNTPPPKKSNKGYVAYLDLSKNDISQMYAHLFDNEQELVNRNNLRSENFS